jgi:tetratricopeptide (TPR) repeat protein
MDDGMDTSPDGEGEPASSASDERANLAAFMLSRQQINDDDDDDDETAAALAEAAAARHARRDAEKKTGASVQRLVQRAEAAAAQNKLMDAVGFFTEALALDERNVNILAARASLCGRMNLFQAVLHDGEEIIKITPDWHQGHAVCGSALFCMRQWAPSVRAYRRALEFPQADDSRRGLEEALEQAQARANEELRMMVLKEDVAELTRLLFGGGSDGDGSNQAVDLEAREPSHGFTALALATAAGKLESAKLLLRAGAQPDATDKFGKTAIMWAAAAGHEALATALWRGKADLTLQDKSGWDPLLAACHGGHVRLATVWLANADVNRATVDGTTALMAAAQSGKTAVVKLLLQRNAEPAAANAKGHRALEHARAGKHDEVVELLQPLTPGGPPR